MATTVEPHGATQSYVDPDEYIDFQLAKTQSQIKTTEILTSASGLGIAVLCYVLTFVVLDQWVIQGGFGYWARAAWLGILAVLSGAWLVWRILIPSFRTVHELYAAKMIESADPTLKSSLLNLIDLQLHGRETQSPTVRTSMEKRAAVELSKVDVDHAVNHQSLLRLAYALLAVVVVCSLYVMFSPKDAFSSVQRLLLPASQTAVATRTTITNVSPEDKKLLVGELLTVEADILGQAPPQVTLVYTTGDREFVNQPVDMQRLEEGIPRFRGVISGEKGRGVMQDMTYRIEAGDARTRDFHIQVVEPPSSNVQNVSYAFPAYMKLDPKVVSGGHVDGWEGTKVIVSAITNIPVQSALLVMTDSENPHAKGEEIRMTIREGKQLSAEWTLGFRSDGTFARYYHIECTTAAGESDPQPTVYAIKIQPDQRPDVALIYPTQDLERPANAVVPLLVKAADPDFQLRFVTLRVEKGGEEIHSASLLDEERQVFEGTYDFTLEKLGAGGGLKPGDEILYWIEARDNKQPHGNRSTTPRLKIKISPPAKADELAKQLEEDRQQQQDQLAQADPDPNQEKPDAQPAEEGQPPRPPMKPQPKKPGEKPEPKPGEPRPEQDPAQLEEPDQQAEGQPDQPRQNKPDANSPKQRGKGDSNQPMPGNKGQEQKQSKEQGAGGEAGERSPDAKPDDQTGDAGKNEDSTQPGQNGKGSNSKPPKKGPADDQTALRKLIDKQEEKGQDSSDESPEKDPPQTDPQNKDTRKPGESQQGTGEQGQSGTDPMRGKDPMSSKEKKQSDPDPEGQAGNESEASPTGKNSDDKSNPMPGKNQPQPNSDKSKTAPDQPRQDPQNKQQGKSASKNKGAGNQPSAQEKGTNETSANEKGTEKSATEKSSQEKQAEEAQNDNPQAKPNKQGKPEQGNSQTGKQQNDPSSKAMKKQPDGPGEAAPKNDQQRADKPQNAPSDKPDQGAENPQSATGDKPGEDTKGPMEKAEKSPDGQSGQAEDSKDQEKSASKAKGAGNKPSDEPGPENTDTQPGSGGNKQSNSKPENEKEKAKGEGENSEDTGTAEESPTNADPKAVKKAATGDEEGPAEGQQNPETEQATRAKKEIQRKADSPKGAMRKSDDPAEPGSKKERGSKDPMATKAKSDGSMRPDEQKGGTNKNSKQPPEKRPGTEATEDEPNPGAGQPNQKSKKSDSGEAGGNTPMDQGTSGSKQKGTGDTKPDAGNQTPDQQQQGGQPGKQPGPGSTKKPTEKDGQPSDDSGQPGANSGENPSSDKPAAKKNAGENAAGDESAEDKPGAQPMPGEGGSKPGEGDSGKPGQSKGQPQPGGPNGKGGQPGKAGQGGGTPGQGAANDDQPEAQAGNDGNGIPRRERQNRAPAEQDQAAQEAEEKANEEFARKASNLVLKKLRKDLDRGEVDQQMLDDLGWTKEDLERFVQRLDQQLNETPTNDDSPEAVARRRQFEETLKTLGLSSKTKKRTAASGKTTRVNELGGRKIEPPPEYKELFEEYTKELAKPATTGSKK